VTERCDLPGRRVWRVLLCLPLALPSYVSSYAWSSLGPWFQGMFGASSCSPSTAFPGLSAALAALRGMDPNFEDVARSLGHNRWRTFWRVVLPQALPALGGGALLVASHMLAEFGALAFLRVETFTTPSSTSINCGSTTRRAALLSAVLMALCLPVVMAEIKLRSGRRFARISRGSARPPQLVPSAV